MALVVFDIGIHEFHGNRVFDPGVASRFPGALPFVRLHREAQRAGFVLLTSDVYLREERKRRGLLLSDMHSPVAEALIREGLVPAASLCMESPLVAYDFYHRLDRHSRRYPHVFYFRGMKERVTSPFTTFHDMYFPQSRREVVGAAPPWGERGFLAMVSSGKTAFPRRRISNIKDLRREWIRRTDPWMRSDLYRQRVLAVKHFARRDDFDLYGHRWQEFMDREGGEAARAVEKAWRGPVPDKIATLSGFRFAICFENTRFPGYVTEKIFDCFFAGTIPVYLGAPDIADFVPERTFIDFSRFRSFKELEGRLESMSETEASRMLDAARAFLVSEAFGKFHESRFAESMVETLEVVARKEGLG